MKFGHCWCSLQEWPWNMAHVICRGGLRRPFMAPHAHITKNQVESPGSMPHPPGNYNCTLWTAPCQISKSIYNIRCAREYHNKVGGSCCSGNETAVRWFQKEVRLSRCGLVIFKVWKQAWWWLGGDVGRGWREQAVVENIRCLILTSSLRSEQADMRRACAIRLHQVIQAVGVAARGI